MKSKLYQLTELGQEVWHDDLYRELILSGDLKKMIEEDGVSGLTSNPTIFERAFKNDPIYLHDMEKLIEAGKSVDRIYDTLLFTDIRLAARAFEEIYDESDREFGYVCLEVSPHLSRKPEETVKEVKRLVGEVEVENVMVKVPGTDEGISAIEKLVADGYNINVTLLFSVNHYRNAAEAYIRGIKKRKEKDLSVRDIHGVASVFLSRIDTKVDNKLQEIINSAGRKKQEKELAERLMGKASTAIGKLVYRAYKELFEGKEFSELKKSGANVQKPLWASTGTKNRNYSDVKYAEDFIYPNTVITLPGKTMKAFREHGNPELSSQNFDQQKKIVKDLKELGIDLDTVCQELQNEGEDKFIKSYDITRKVIENKIEKAANQ